MMNNERRSECFYISNVPKSSLVSIIRVVALGKLPFLRGVYAYIVSRYQQKNILQRQLVNTVKINFCFIKTITFLGFPRMYASIYEYLMYISMYIYLHTYICI